MPDNLMQALLEAQKLIGSIHKGRMNTFDHYAYASTEDHVRDCREALHACGLVAYGCDAKILQGAEKGPPAIISCKFVLAHPASKESVVSTVDVSIHMDRKGAQWDKQAGAAKSYAKKYWLRDLLLVPQEELEPDQQGSQDAEPARTAAPAAAPAFDTKAFQSHARSLQMQGERLGIAFPIPNPATREEAVAWSKSTRARIAEARIHEQGETQ